MDFSILLSFISIAGAISSLIVSIINSHITKKEMKIKINMTNNELEIKNIDIEKIKSILDSLSLEKISKDIICYFEEISKDNNYTVKIFKIMNDNTIHLIFPVSSSDNNIYLLKENIEFIETSKTKKPYYNNNIPYFYKHGNEYFNENPNWNRLYQSIVCCPIINENKTIVGFLTIEIEKPLNDLIDINNITKFLQQKCELINKNQEFNGINNISCNDK